MRLLFTKGAPPACVSKGSEISPRWSESRKIEMPKAIWNGAVLAASLWLVSATHR